MRTAPAMPFEPGRQLGRRRVSDLRQVLREELHFLRHAPLDDGVVPVEAEGERLPETGSPRAPWPRSGSPTARPSAAAGPGRQATLIWRRSSGVITIWCEATSSGSGVRIQRTIGDEDREPDQQEVQQRLAQQSPEPRRSAPARRRARRAPALASGGGGGVWFRGSFAQAQLLLPRAGGFGARFGSNSGAGPSGSSAWGCGMIS